VLFTFMMATLDGYYEGPNQEFDWPVVDEEFTEFSNDQLDSVEALMFGRVTYEGMYAYWTAPQTVRDDPGTASRMNTRPKVVVSSTLASADWPGTVLLRGSAEVADLKRRTAEDIAILGSSTLTARLLAAGLVDELRVMIAPVLLGAGRSIFHSAERASLSLKETRRFGSGNVLLTYRTG